MHDSYRHCLSPNAHGEAALRAMADELFGTAAPVADAPHFELVHAHQGQEAVDLVAAAGENRFAVAFVDICMPPGIDGRETARRIRAIDPDINLVVVTGFSDYAPIEIGRVAGPVDKLSYIAKPFEVEEVVQTATALARRWQVDRELAAVRAQLAEKVELLEEQTRELAVNEMKALHLANHDPLTDAPNRLAFIRSLSGWVRADECFAMVMLDLDRFKLVNDTLGHLAGDEMLRSICDILSAQVPEGGMVARLGGDEFALLFPTPGVEAAVMEAERMIHACAANFRIFGHTLQGSASAGLVVIEPGADADPTDVMRRADLALNDAKKNARGGVRLFDERMDESVRFRRLIESGLSRAIEQGELRLVYQPIVSHDTLEVVAFEALMRWDSGEYGTISPAMFIPIAEESNLIHELGDWVLGEALKTLEHWPGQYVSVNFSPRQFRRPNFVGHIVERVDRAGIAPSRLQIEITETAIFDDAERAAETLYRLRQMGFRIALDDFGTGYSSLYNIRKFALDCLKIDRSFIDSMGRERESAAIVHSIIHLGRALGLEVVAEGVETEAQVQSLRIAGCSHLQGFHLARPLEADRTFEIAEAGHVATSAVIADAPRGSGTHG
ncbi:GGDEF domain-containing response regulator [Sphingomonas spermidinifaciens]|uniref:GGDEF domain-containing response regulator n=2 Tax=Sphingomonas spermidinifaciens TaxID=1141889 RepID=A0A2A4BA18_9SPHN|nr:GGDEF domain-containing response regulator [Sphingomonas spermidinifaciens]